jgi:branched-chain amino acid transport system substrate-binding protein
MLRLGQLSFVFIMLLCGQTLAQTSGVVRIGVMNDMAGVYSDDQGPGSVLGAQLAVEDHGGPAAGRKVEVVSADHQNKTDLGAAIARRWIENEGVTMIADLPNSAIALAVNEIVRDHNSVMLASGAGTALLTGGNFRPYPILRAR